MSTIPGSGFTPNYVELIATNVGKMLAQSNLGISELRAEYSFKGEVALRELLSGSLAKYAEKYPGVVNLPFIIQTTLEFLRAELNQPQQFTTY